MALGKIHSHPHLLDTLLELNDLIKGLGSDDCKKAINSLKAEKEQLEKATKLHDEHKAKHDASAIQLSKVTDENELYIASAKKEREALEASKLENVKHLNRIQTAQNAVDASQKELDGKISAHNMEVAAHSDKLAERERKVSARKIELDGLIEEYSKKLYELKKITG